MLFVWETGETRNVSYGSMVVGFRVKGRRPRWAVVTEFEMDAYFPPKDFSHSLYALKVTHCLEKGNHAYFIKDAKNAI